MRKLGCVLFLALSLGVIGPGRLIADEPPTSVAASLKVPDGFSIELAAGSPLVERPIVAAFDDDGRLYVAESSGSNDPVQKQLEDKPHRIVRLEDTDGDGRFDRRTVFADHMMFPEGAMFLDGSLYVSAAPSIWKLTDRDGDGVADDRVEWFQGKTLTGCANDLHGPYPGPDGWIYWCKGAFAEQTCQIHGREWKTTASHIFRCRPDGTGLEPVITAGMDNPVDVAFTADGEMILSGTYFNCNPRVDGLAHAVYGGVYGKEHGVLTGHPRTGELMPVFDPMTATAPCGLERYDSDVFGIEFRDNLFLCQFNMRKVSRHILSPAGSTFKSTDSDFVWSENVDFHPTDVQVDADGSLLVIDTGGWYKLCCPTSQLWKPEVTGGIYRVRRVGAKPPEDPRGRKIAWAKQTLQQLWDLHEDIRPAVRSCANREFVRRAKAADRSQDVLHGFAALEASPAGDGIATQSEIAAVARAWTLSQIDSPESHALLEESFSTDSKRLRHAIIRAVNINRDSDTLYSELMLYSLKVPNPADKRALAETIGRLADPVYVPNLLDLADRCDDRVLQHSIIYALVELHDPAATREGLSAKSPKTVAAAMIALDQMPDGSLKAVDVIPRLYDSDGTLQSAALWVVRQHPNWGNDLTDWFRSQLQGLPSTKGDEQKSASDELVDMLVTFSSQATVQELLAATAEDGERHASAAAALRVMAQAKLREAPRSWVRAQAKDIAAADPELLPLAVAAARGLPAKATVDKELRQALLGVADSSAFASSLRVEALAIVVPRMGTLSEAQFKLLQKALATDREVRERTAAAGALAESTLSSAQLLQLCNTVKSAGPMELNRLLAAFAKSNDDELGLRLVSSLTKAENRSALRLDLLREDLSKYGPRVQFALGKLESLVNVDAEAQRKRIEELLPIVAKGDVRRGEAVFYSTKASCSSCHRLGHAGGETGPDLSHVGKTRSERDILESVMFPSLSFVRSYEPMQFTLADGRMLNGIIRDETATEYTLAIGANQITRVTRADVEDIAPSKVSIMPAGLDRQLTSQELADLVTFLKSAGAK